MPVDAGASEPARADSRASSRRPRVGGGRVRPAFRDPSRPRNVVNAFARRRAWHSPITTPPTGRWAAARLSAACAPDRQRLERRAVRGADPTAQYVGW